MALAYLNFRLRFADSVDASELGRFILWTLVGGAVLGASFACPAIVAAYAGASSGKSRGFCTVVSALALILCWLLFAGVSASGAAGLSWVLPAAAALTTAGAAGFIWFSTR